MFDCDLILDKFNSLHQAQNLLIRFKARVIERCADWCVFGEEAQSGISRMRQPAEGTR